MNDLPKCPACQSAYTYEANARYLCAECAHEWPCVDGDVESVEVDHNIDCKVPGIGAMKLKSEFVRKS